MERRADQGDAVCEVHTFREGALSLVGHDLLLDVTRFEVQVEGREVRARFDASSLAVRCAVRDGVEDPRALSLRDRAQIEETARAEVLGARAHPWITFRATLPEGFAGRGAVQGELTLHGVTRPITVAVAPEGAGVRARATVRQKEFGMKPYAALMGTLRVRPEVEVVVTLPWAQAG